MLVVEYVGAITVLVEYVDTVMVLVVASGHCHGAGGGIRAPSRHWRWWLNAVTALEVLVVS